MSPSAAWPALRESIRHGFAVARALAGLALALLTRDRRRYWQSRMRLAGARGESDMVADPAEQFYARLYLEAVTSAAPAGHHLKILDLGCQAGRLAIPLARTGHHVTGVDRSRRWIERCRVHAAEAGVEINLLCEDVANALTRFSAGAFDLVLATELLYTLPNHREVLGGLARLLAPGGRLVASHRTRYYLLATLVRYRLYPEARRVLAASEGPILGTYYNWFDAGELERIYRAAGLRILERRGIGTLSGLGVDGLARLASPARLGAAEREELLALERACGPEYAGQARYLLVVAARAGEP